MKPAAVSLFIFSILIQLAAPLLVLWLLDLNIAPGFLYWLNSKVAGISLVSSLAFSVFLVLLWKHSGISKLFRVLLTVLFSLAEAFVLLCLFAVLLSGSYLRKPVRQDIYKDQKTCVYLMYDHWDSHKTGGILGFFQDDYGPGSEVKFYICDPSWPVDAKEIGSAGWKVNYQEIPIENQNLHHGDSVFYLLTIPALKDKVLFGVDLQKKQGDWLNQP